MFMFAAFPGQQIASSGPVADWVGWKRSYKRHELFQGVICSVLVEFVQALHLLLCSVSFVVILRSAKL